MSTASLLVATIGGVASWSFGEYALHKWYGHNAKGRNHFSREHLKHHKDGQYFAPTWQKLTASSIAFALVFPLSVAIAGLGLGLTYSASFAATYVLYEWLHRRCHTHPPATRYGAWMRKHHLHHHYTRPKENHGVTSSLWDLFFRTKIPATVVRVPERKLFEVPWLVDDEGQLRPRYQGDYVIARQNRR